jgi:hypothetical protein
LAILVATASACGDDSSGSTKRDAAPDTTPMFDVLPMADASFDAPPGTVPLTVKNVLNWCSVIVDGGTASTAATIVTNVMPGAITLKAQRANSTFRIADNMWHLTDGDSGTGETGTVTNPGTPTAESTVTATVVASTPKCVWICCPFTDGSGCETATTDLHDCP